MDVESFLSIVNTVWGFISITAGVIKGLGQYANALCYTTTTYISEGGRNIGNGRYYSSGEETTQTNTCDCCFPCNITNIVCKAIATNDDSLFNIINEDLKLIPEPLVSLNQNQGSGGIVMNNLGNQNLQQTISTTTTNTLLGRIDIIKSAKEKIIQNPVRFLKGTSGIIAFPSLINYFIEANSDQAKIARIFTIGAPIFQEVGLNTLSMINYATLFFALFINSPRFIGYVNRGLFPILYIVWGLAMTIASYYYSSKLTDPIEKFFLISIMTVRAFGGSCAIDCCIDFGSIFTAGISL